MATRTARRGLGARVILALVAVFAIAAMSLPASAHANSVVGTNVDSGWAAATKLVPDEPGGKPFDPTDPPWQKASGPVTDLVSRWALTICDADVEVTGALGAVAGIVTLEEYAGRPNRVLRFVVDDPAYPHGLTAAGAPYQVDFTAGHQEANGACTTPITEPRVFGLDRFHPLPPKITSPAGDFQPWRGGGLCSGLEEFGEPICTGPAAGLLRTFTRDYDQINFAFVEPGSPVLVEGSAADKLTWPDDDRAETSGISRVIIRLYESSFPFTSSRLKKVYEVENDCTGVIADGSTSNGLPACALDLAFSVDITPDLTTNRMYAIRAFALDLAGDRGACLDGPQCDDLTAQQRSGETKSVSFYYA